MEYRIEIEEYATQKMVHAYISGMMTDAERIHVGEEIGRRCKENKINKVIFDIREAKLDYPLVVSHHAVLSLSDLGMTKNDYCAVIYLHNKEQLEHADTVARNRSIFNVGFFQTLEQGIDWLVSKGGF